VTKAWPRQYADYLPTDGFTTLNVVYTIGAFILALSMLPFMWNLFKSWRYGEPVTVDDPWGYGNSLEWATSCPPPRHNFTELPRIRSERPALELQPTHGGAEPTPAATTPRCTADAIREWQPFLRRISPSVSSRTGRSAPPFRRQYPPVCPSRRQKHLRKPSGATGSGVLARRRSPMYLVVRAQRGRNVDSVMGSDPLSSGRPGSPVFTCVDSRSTPVGHGNLLHEIRPND